MEEIKSRREKFRRGATAREPLVSSWNRKLLSLVRQGGTRCQHVTDMKVRRYVTVTGNRETVKDLDQNAWIRRLYGSLGRGRRE